MTLATSPPPYSRFEPPNVWSRLTSVITPAERGRFEGWHHNNRNGLTDANWWARDTEAPVARTDMAWETEYTRPTRDSSTPATNGTTTDQQPRAPWPPTTLIAEHELPNVLPTSVKVKVAPVGLHQPPIPSQQAAAMVCFTITTKAGSYGDATLPKP